MLLLTFRIKSVLLHNVVLVPLFIVVISTENKHREENPLQWSYGSLIFENVAGIKQFVSVASAVSHRP